MVKTQNLLIGARGQRNYNVDTAAAISASANELFVFATRSQDGMQFMRNVAKLGLSWSDLSGRGKVDLTGPYNPEFTVSAVSNSGIVNARSLKGGEYRDRRLKYPYPLFGSYHTPVELDCNLNMSIRVKSTFKNMTKNIGGNKLIDISYSEFIDMIWKLADNKFAKGSWIRQTVDLPEPKKSEVGDLDIMWDHLTAKIKMTVL